MKLKVFVKNVGELSLTDKDYLASGGEASIYVKNSLAYKIYHDTKKMVPENKIKELSTITADNVLIPQNVIYSTNDHNPIGYTTQFINKAHPLCKLFTKTFKQANSISNGNIVDIIRDMQLTTQKIHDAKCLIVDFNEFNIIVSPDFQTPYFIDVDSYQTPSYKATALMESVRDRFAPHGKFSELTDWFSFAVLIFQMYINVHPYKGKHPKYKPTEWSKRMDDGVSVFDPKASIPSICNDFSVIPKRHLEWLKYIFVQNKRIEPPLPDSSVPIAMPEEFLVIEAKENFDVNLIHKYPEEILRVLNSLGINYAVSKNAVYKENKILISDINKYDGFELCESNNMSLVACKSKNGMVKFETLTGEEIGVAKSNEMMCRNGCIYTMNDGRIFENSFISFGSKIMHNSRVACNSLDQSTHFYDGVIIQDLLGKYHITLPYKKGMCLFRDIPELNGHKIVDAKSERNICVIIAQKGGIYSKFIMVFDDDFKSYSLRKIDDVIYENINFAVLSNGVCIMINGNDVDIFKDNKQVKTIRDTFFDSSMKLFNCGEVVFVNNKALYSVKVKK